VTAEKGLRSVLAEDGQNGTWATGLRRDLSYGLWIGSVEVDGVTVTIGWAIVRDD